MHGDGRVTKEAAASALTRMDVDQEGLDQMDRRLLEVLIKHYDGGPVGIKTLAVACSEEVRTLEDIYEPYLIQCGFLKRTPRGRVATGPRLPPPEYSAFLKQRRLLSSGRRSPNIFKTAAGATGGRSVFASCTRFFRLAGSLP